MGREGKNRPLARAGRLAWSPPTRRRATQGWRTTRAVYYCSGTKGQQPLVFPAPMTFRGKGCGATSCAARDYLSAAVLAQGRGFGAAGRRKGHSLVKRLAHADIGSDGRARRIARCFHQARTITPRK
jgi:hypothetical protein